VVTTSSSATGIVGQNITYLEVGLKLDVEPLISPDEEITLKLSLEVSNITKQVETGNGGTAYQIGTRFAGTTLRLQDGETQFLGGLISKTDSSSAARIPGLGDLPVLGRLFGNQQDNSAQSELVLSITPRIVRSALRPDTLQTVVRMGTESAPRLQRSPADKAAAPANSHSGQAYGGIGA
jgi:general secretion pathway protein D